MKKLKIKTLLPLLIGLFIIIGGLSILSTQETEARGGYYCNSIPKAADCWPGDIDNCICLVVTPDPPNGPVGEDDG